jgi:dihydropteroate synthase
MGIVNATPDSFSDGGRHAGLAAQLAQCERLIRAGADILDLGGESTRPGSPPVPLAEELARVLPLVREAVKLGVPVSVDSYKPEVMAAVLDAGADILNDIWAFRHFSGQSGGQSSNGMSALDVAARHPSCGLCVMHMHGNPQTMQVQPMAGDAAQTVAAVRAFLGEQRDALVARGVAPERIVLDPGIGFGKTVAQNFALLARQRDLLALGQPLLLGWSRKSALGAVLADEAGHPLPPDARDTASVAAALLAIERGARIVRVHDVAATVQAVKIWCEMERQSEQTS